MASLLLLVGIAALFELGAEQDIFATATVCAAVFAPGLLLFGYALSDIYKSRDRTAGFPILRSARVRLIAACITSLALYFTVLHGEPLPKLASLSDSDEMAQAFLWMAFLSLLGYGSSEFRKLRSPNTQPEYHPELPALTRAGDPVTADVVIRLRGRAARMNLLSLATLALIGCVLILGYRLFTEAEQAATQTVNIPELRQQLATKSGELQRVETQLLTWVKPSTRVMAEVFADLTAKRETLRVTVEGLRDDIQRATSGQSDPGPRGDQPWRYALSLLSTKIGAVALLIFGVQILVSLHYYTANQASKYDSRADLLQLLNANDIQNARTLKNALLPDEVQAENKTPAAATDPNLPKLVTDVVSGLKRELPNPS